MTTLTINLIGAGKLGKTLGLLIHAHHAGQIKAICNSDLTSSRAAAAIIKQGKPVLFKDLPLANIFFITTPDDKIEQICGELVKQNLIKPGNIIVHCSGALTSDVLLEAKKSGASIASVHPLHSFANPTHSAENFADTLCTLEGDDEAVLVLKMLFAQIGGKIIPIAKDKKIIYHAACVMASNYLVTLAEFAVNCFAEADLPASLPTKLTTQLMTNTLENIQHVQSPRQALTGPIQRGDGETIFKHIHALKNAELKSFYATLGEYTLTIAGLNAEKQEELEKILQD